MSTPIKIVIGVAVMVVAVVVAVALLSGGDDDEPQSAGNGTTQSERKSGDSGSASDSGSDSPEPALRTVATKRLIGRNPAVNAGALMRDPGEVWIRVSAAPKQEVTVNWTLACGVGSTAQGSYDATPPDTRQIELPEKNPKTCVASTSSQLIGRGRIKVAILRDR